MADDEEGFRITDRRGRGDEPAAAPAGAEGPRPASPPSAPGPPPGPGRGPTREAARGHGAPDLGGLFVMFAGSALIHLGEAADPMTGQRGVDLEQAREAIDVLMLLREKTEGNRTAEESQLLEEILYDLQVRYVHAAGPRRPS